VEGVGDGARSWNEAYSCVVYPSRARREVDETNQYLPPSAGIVVANLNVELWGIEQQEREGKSI
jgi:hypothetical protein